MATGVPTDGGDLTGALRGEAAPSRGLSVTGGSRRAAAAFDVLGLVLFVVIGRASHHHGESVGGIVSTAWPFAAGLGAGWLLVAAAGRWSGRSSGRLVVPLASLPGGAAVCVATVTIGMALRVVAGQGTAPAFVGVATGFLGAVMLVGRLASRAAGRLLARARRG